MSAEFTLHPKLAEDTLPILDLALSRVVLMKDSRYPWLILIPREAGLKELTDLSPHNRAVLMEEAAACAQALKASHVLERVNVAALGNMVPQLHLHVIGRRIDDAAWPGPVWGVGEAVAYDDPAPLIETLQAAISAALQADTKG